MKILKISSSNQGFTLIELLVVITIIGILAVSVLAAINPIEQVNKARDAARKQDAAQLLSAIERYYTAKEKYPWNSDNVKTATGYNKLASAKFSGVSSDTVAGVCGAKGAGTSGCADSDAELGELVTTDELKTAFAKKKYFSAAPGLFDTLYISKQVNDTSLYICFVPSSKAQRTGSNLKSLNGAVEAGGTQGSLALSECDSTGMDYSSLAKSCFVCVPDSQ